MNTVAKTLTITSLAAAITACGGSSDGGSTGTVSFGLTDAPATDLSNVTVAFTQIRLKPSEGEWIEFPLEGFETINLLDLQNGTTEPLISDKEVPAGTYNQIRLIVDTDNSYVQTESGGDARYTLGIPSGEQSGLKLQGEFVVAANTETDFTIDFNAQKAIVDPQGQALGDYMLRPALRLVNDLEVGSIAGEVDQATINSASGCDYDGSAYVYTGADVTPIDLNVNNSDSPLLMTVPVANADSDSLLEYKAAFLTEGDYTVSYSCQTDNNEEDDTLSFFGTQTVTVTAGEEVQADTITSN